MNNEHIDSFNNALIGALDVYNKKASSFTFRVWWEALKKYDLPAVLNAISRHIENPDNGQWAPKPADIIKLIDGSSQDRALVAWAKVEKTIRTVGGYATVVFDDHLIHSVVRDLGGWIKVSGGLEKDLPFLAKRFENQYRTLANKPLIEYPSNLQGLDYPCNAY